MFNAIYGPDGRDDTVVDAPFVWNPDVPLAKLKIGYIKPEFEPPAERRARGDGRGDGGRGRRGTLAADAAACHRKSRDGAPKNALKLLNDALDVYRKAGATLHPDRACRRTPPAYPARSASS